MSLLQSDKQAGQLRWQEGVIKDLRRLVRGLRGLLDQQEQRLRLCNTELAELHRLKACHERYSADLEGQGELQRWVLGRPAVAGLAKSNKGVEPLLLNVGGRSAACS